MEDKDEKIIHIYDYKEKQGNKNVYLSLNTDHEKSDRLQKLLHDIVEQSTVHYVNNLVDNSNFYNKELSASNEPGGENMDNSDYVTQKDLAALENRLEQKINYNHEILIHKIESNKNEINLKFDNQLLEFKNILNEKFEDQKEKQRVANRWIISTVIGSAGVLFAFLKFFL